KPPFAYESAKTAATTAIPAAALRRSTFCAPITLVRTTARYSNGRVRGAEPASGRRPCGRRIFRGAVSGACLRRRTVGEKRLQGVCAERRRPRWNRRPERGPGIDIDSHLRQDRQGHQAGWKEQQGVVRMGQTQRSDGPRVEFS